MKIRLIWLALVFILATSMSCYAATYYISPSGSDTSGSGTTANPWATIHKGIGAMTGGDTLILKDGTYTGINNVMSNASNTPPIGSSGAWTIIKAENDGGALIDGENARTMLYLNFGSIGNRYWRFEGLLWCRGLNESAFVARCSYVKFLKCGFYDAYNTGNTVSFWARNSSYILMENCYSYGSGRYKFLFYYCDYSIMRQCVGRADIINASGEPCAIFTTYASTYCEVQNCIAIDSDQTSHYTASQYAGCFFVPCTDGNSDRINFNQCIGLNVKIGGISSANNTDSSNITWSNCVFWACDNSDDVLNMVRGSINKLLHCTFGVSTGSTYFSYADGDATTMTDTIVCNVSTVSSLLYDVETQDYNCYYGNASSNGIAGLHNRTVNPIYNISSNPTGALKYITRIETSSNLNGVGSFGTDIGANVKTLVGNPGTLYGESGYATDTGVSMWPFPNEDLIRTKMKAYNAGGVSGNRGFCADGQTLTKYIWGYLGNQIPFLVPPTGLAAVFSSGNTLSSGIFLTWEDNSLEEAGYKIERKEEYGVWVQIAEVGENIIQYIDTDVLTGTAYYYRVKAFNVIQETSYSNEALVTVAAAVPGTTPTQTSGSGGGGGCFIATAAFGTPMAQEVISLCHFRDEYLLCSWPGKVFVALYYQYSPVIADHIRDNDQIKAYVRILLEPLIFFAQRLN